MLPAIPPRATVAFAIVLAAAAITAALSELPLTTITVGVLGVAAVMVALWTEQPPPPQPPAPPPAPSPPDAATLIAQLAEPMLLLDDGRIAIANPAARRLLGEHIVGEDVRTAIRHPAAAERLATGAADGRPIDLVGLGALAQRWEMHVAHFPGDFRLVQLIDRTGSYATERMRVDFVANASHELRTPLASILGYVETLMEDAGDDPAVRQRFLRIVLDEAQRMQRLVEDLMSLSRIEAEKYRAPASAVAIDALVAEVRAELVDHHGARERAIRLDVAEGLPPVAGDRGQLSQMLHNLVGNALKYGAPGTPVTIALARDGARNLRLTVIDEGEGIPPDHIPRLTERFYRVDAGRSRSLGGTGLGLAIVKHIVERHRGRLDIASEVGRGTRVSVTLPVSWPGTGGGSETAEASGADVIKA